MPGVVLTDHGHHLLLPICDVMSRNGCSMYSIKKATCEAPRGEGEGGRGGQSAQIDSVIEFTRRAAFKQEVSELSYSSLHS
jgi:hypothetical protein